MGNHPQFRRQSDKVVVRKCGWIECSGRTEDEPPDDDGTDVVTAGASPARAWPKVAMKPSLCLGPLEGL